MLKKKPRFLRLPLHEKVLFFKRLSLYMNSGVSLPLTFLYIQEVTTHKQYLYIYQQIGETILQGESISTGLAIFPNIFDAFCIGFIKAGENSGSLPKTLEHLSIILLKKVSLHKKVMGAMLYPIIVLLSTIILASFLTFYLFPKILPVFKGLKTSLPVSTRILIYSNSFVSKNWFWILITFGVAVFVVCASLRSKKIVRFLERICLRLPILGKFYTYYILSLAMSTLAIQLQGNVQLPIAIDLIEKTLPGSIYPLALEKIQKNVYQGLKFSDALHAFPRLFPRMVSQIIATGETTGSLTESVSLLAETYEEYLDDLVKNITTLIEPILMICMGCIVGFVALAIITPIYKVTQNLTIQ
jgi:type II secretory pathway component PulF